MNTGHKLSSDEYATKCIKLRDDYLSHGNLIKARSFQFKADNALLKINHRGRIPSELLPVAEKLPNRKERRKDVQGKPKLIRTASVEQGSDNPSKKLEQKDARLANLAVKNLYKFLTDNEGGDKIWGAKLDDNDVIVIYSSEKLSIPATYRGFAVENRVGDAPVPTV